MKKFWSISNEAGAFELHIRGPIDSDKFWGDEVTPAEFKEDLAKASGPLTVWINSPGGNVIAASEIYTALLNYPGKVTVKIDGLAASAASVIAMAGSKVMMAPTAEMMIHNPSTIAMGDHNEMKEVIKLLDSVKQAIINAYEKKTGLSRDELSKFMDQTKWMDANEAIKLGFADEMIDKTTEDNTPADDNKLFSREDVDKIVKATSEKMITKLVARYTPNNKHGNNETDSGKKSGEEGGTTMFKTIEELTAACPDLVAQIREQAAKDAVDAERTRLQGIDEIVSMVGDDEMVKDAKYGHPVTAEKLAFDALKKQSELAKQHLADTKDDAEKSGAKKVEAAPAPKDEAEGNKKDAPADLINAGREAAKKLKEAK